MGTEIVINKHPLQVKQYNGQNVVTFKDIDLCHERPNGTASRNFRTNKQHFVEGMDYFKISPDEFRRTIGDMDKRQNNEIVLITESGYYMIVKSFTDELSWVVQRELVNTYFKYKEDVSKVRSVEPYEYFDKTYNGEPVLTISDLEHMTGVKSATANAYFKRHGVLFMDYYLITKSDLRNFKNENPQVKKLASKALVVTKDGFMSFCRAYNIQIDLPKCFVPEQYEQLKFSEQKNEVEKLCDCVNDIKNQFTAMSVLMERLVNLKSVDTSKPEIVQSSYKVLDQHYSPMICETLHCIVEETSRTISKLSKYI